MKSAVPEELIPTRVTIKHVAESSGYSIGTVSRALRDDNKVLLQTRRHIKAVANQLGYVPDVAAQSLRGGQSRVVTCAVPLASNPFFSEVLNAVSRVFRQSDYALVFVNIEDRPERELELLSFIESRRIDGLIATLGQELNSPLLNRLETLRIPTVLVEREAHGKFDSVVSDQSTGVYRAVSHLIQLGHTRIALIASGMELRQGRGRRAGFQMAYSDAGLDLSLSHLHTMQSPGDFTVQDALGVLRSANRPTSVIIGSQEIDKMLRAMRELNLKVGEDISIISMGDSDLVDLFTPSISALRWDGTFMGEVAANTLLKRLSGKGGPVKEFLSNVDMILRDSCRPPK